VAPSPTIKLSIAAVDHGEQPAIYKYFVPLAYTLISVVKLPSTEAVKVDQEEALLAWCALIKTFPPVPLPYAYLNKTSKLYMPHNVS
jgi:hypothetical protein